jgi:hypothetical protein
MLAPLNIVRLSAKEMQKRFNEGGYWERARQGHYTQLVRESRHPALTVANEPFCTQSQMVSYLDKDEIEVARVHQYLRMDGTIGASGKPDPKRLREGDIVYRLEKKRQAADAGPRPGD